MYKILVADDEELERKVLVFTLQNSRLPVEIVGEAASGRQAIEIAENTSPDIIFMDIKMPGIGGLEATQRIKQTNPGTEIIMLTAYGKFTYSQQAIRAQATDYLLKPTHPQQIIETTKQVLAKLANKKFAAGPTLDMAGFAEQVRLGNLQEANASFQLLFAQLKVQDPGPSPARLNSFGFRLMVFAVQSLLDSGAELTKLSVLEEQLAAELAKVTSFTELEAWAGNMLKRLFALNLGKPLSREQLVVQQVIDYLSKNLGTDLRLDEVAAHVHLSPSYLSRVFSKSTGKGFAEYLTLLRLKKAKHRLSTSHDTIEQIAADLGFCSNSYFTAVFRKLEGITPSQFRARHYAQ